MLFVSDHEQLLGPPFSAVWKVCLLYRLPRACPRLWRAGCDGSAPLSWPGGAGEAKEERDVRGSTREIGDSKPDGGGSG